jgi:hypothetical protein
MELDSKGPGAPPSWSGKGASTGAELRFRTHFTKNTRSRSFDSLPLRLRFAQCPVAQDDEARRMVQLQAVRELAFQNLIDRVDID